MGEEDRGERGRVRVRGGRKLGRRANEVREEARYIARYSHPVNVCTGAGVGTKFSLLFLIRYVLNT